MLRPFAHPAACCFAVLRKVWTGQSFEPTTPNISFVPRSFCTPLLTLVGLRTRQDGCRIQVYKVLWVVSFPRCTAGTKGKILSTWGICTPLLTRTQQLPTLLTQQCWELRRPFARSLSKQSICITSDISFNGDVVKAQTWEVSALTNTVQAQLSMQRRTPLSILVQEISCDVQFTTQSTSNLLLKPKRKK